MKRWVFNPVLNCPRLMDDEWSEAVMKVPSRRLGLQRGNSVSRAVFLLKGQARRGVLPNDDLPNQKCR